MLMNDTVLAKLRASNEKAKRNRDNWKAKAEALAAEREELLDALRWCSGSPDFNEGGQARDGWQKICAPLLAREAVNSPATTTTKEEAL